MSATQEESQRQNDVFDKKAREWEKREKNLLEEIEKLKAGMSSS